MDILSIIAGIFDLYYSKRIAKDERNLLLKERVTSGMFDTAVRLLLNRKEIEITQDVILTGFLLNYFSISNENPMRSLLLEDFHNSHEDIVSLFQTLWNESIENIPVLLKALEKVPSYLQDRNFRYPYIRNLVYAIGAQPQPESLLALEKLASETEDEVIKELSLRQVEKRKLLGRWESDGYGNSDSNKT